MLNHDQKTQNLKFYIDIAIKGECRLKHIGAHVSAGGGVELEVRVVETRGRCHVEGDGEGVGILVGVRAVDADDRCL